MFTSFRLFLATLAGVSLAISVTWLLAGQQADHDHGGMMEHCMKVLEQRQAVLQQLGRGDAELGGLLGKVQEASQAEQKVAALEQLVAKLVELRTVERDSLMILTNLMHTHTWPNI